MKKSTTKNSMAQMMMTVQKMMTNHPGAIFRVEDLNPYLPDKDKKEGTNYYNYHDLHFHVKYSYDSAVIKALIATHDSSFKTRRVKRSQAPPTFQYKDIGDVTIKYWNTGERIRAKVTHGCGARPFEEEPRIIFGNKFRCKCGYVFHKTELVGKAFKLAKAMEVLG